MAKKWIFRRKEDGYMVVYSEKEHKGAKHAEEMMKNKAFELITAVDTADLEPKAYKPVPVVEDLLECPLCGRVVVDDAEMLKHKEEHGGSKKRKTKKV